MKGINRPAVFLLALVAAAPRTDAVAAEPHIVFFLANLAHDPEQAKRLGLMRQRCDTLRDQYGGVYRPHPN